MAAQPKKKEADSKKSEIADNKSLIDQLQSNVTFDFSNKAGTRGLFPDITIKCSDGVLHFMRAFLCRAPVLSVGLEGEINDVKTEIKISDAKKRDVNFVCNWLARLESQKQKSWFTAELKEQIKNEFKGNKIILPAEPVGYIRSLLNIGLLAFRYDITPLLSLIVEAVVMHIGKSSSYPQKYIIDWWETIKMENIELARMLLENDNYSACGKMDIRFANACICLFENYEDYHIVGAASGYDIINVLNSVTEVNDETLETLAEVIYQKCIQTSQSITNLTENFEDPINGEYVVKLQQKLLKLILSKCATKAKLNDNRNLDDIVGTNSQ